MTLSRQSDTARGLLDLRMSSAPEGLTSTAERDAVYVRDVSHNGEPGQGHRCRALLSDRQVGLHSDVQLRVRPPPTPISSTCTRVPGLSGCGQSRTCAC
jgi:hypothetical protein